MNIEKNIRFTANILIVLLNISLSMFIILILGIIYNQTNHFLGTMYYLSIPIILLIIITYVGNSFLLKEIEKIQKIQKRKNMLKRLNHLSISSNP
jgi:Leucine-rich repeat (LRR) protein